jgi:hypothetical protein
LGTFSPHGISRVFSTPHISELWGDTKMVNLGTKHFRYCPHGTHGRVSAFWFLLVKYFLRNFSIWRLCLCSYKNNEDLY